MKHIRPPRLVALAGVAALAVAACSGSGSNPTPVATPTTNPTQAATEAPPAAGVEMAVASSSLGDIVVDGEGLALYLFQQDTQGDGMSVCNDDCAASWPPLVVEDGATPEVGDGVTGEVGTATRDDGTTQVTLNGWPMYHFAGDLAAGDTNGQGLNDAWWVVDGAGDAVKG